MRGKTEGFVTVGTVAVVMVWAFLGNAALHVSNAVISPQALQTEVGQQTQVDASDERIVTHEELRVLNRRYRGLISLCYQRAMRRCEPPKAVVTLELVAGETRAKVESGDDRVLAACISRVVRQYRFPGASDQTMTFPLIIAH